MILNYRKEVFFTKDKIKLDKIEQVIYKYMAKAGMYFNSQNFRGLTKEEKDLMFESEAIPITKQENAILWKEFNRKVRKRVDNRGGYMPEYMREIEIGNKFANKFGGYSNHYLDSYTLEQFYTSIVNEEGYSRAENVFKLIITNVRREFKANSINNNIRRVKAMVWHHLIYLKWVGFRFEYNNKLLLESWGYKVIETTKYIDETYKIDIVVELPNGKNIGIQCKSYSFLNNTYKTSKYIRDNIKGQQMAVANKEIEDVYYLFHNQDGYIIPIMESVKTNGFRIVRAKCLINMNSIIDNSLRIYESLENAREQFKNEMDNLTKDMRAKDE